MTTSPPPVKPLDGYLVTLVALYVIITLGCLGGLVRLVTLNRAELSGLEALGTRGDNEEAVMQRNVRHDARDDKPLYEAQTSLLSRHRGANAAHVRVGVEKVKRFQKKRSDAGHNRAQQQRGHRGRGRSGAAPS